MKNFNKILLFFLTAAFFTACQNIQQKSEEAIVELNRQTYKSVGVVKKVDVENVKLTIDHEDIPGYMNAMEMTTAVKDKTLLNNLNTGDKIKFELERNGSNVVITQITKTGETVIAKGNELYKIHCGECHGEKGEGAKKGIPLISGHALHHTEDEHFKQVAEGEKDKMPAFKDKLKAEEIKEVVRFVRNELQKGKDREDSHKHQH